MASLTGNKIKDTYPGLLKTEDNAIVGATEKQITDGEGNVLPLSAGTNSISFTGDADFTGANVLGIPEAGLVSGAGADSMQSAASLTTTAADASGDNSIAIGNDAVSGGEDGISIGNGARNQFFGAKGISIGCNAFGFDNNGVAIGTNTFANFSAFAGAASACANGYQSVAIGALAIANSRAISFGCNATASTSYSVALGAAACTTALNSVAIGCGVTAAKADTVTVKELETCVAGGGLTLTTPDGLNQPKLTVDNNQDLLIAGNPVGGGGGDPFVPTTVSGANQSLDLGNFNFFDASELTQDTTLSFTNVPTEARFQYSYITGSAAFKLEGASYSNISFTPAEDNDPADIFFKPDGTKMYILGANSSTVYQYSLGTAFDLSTATYDTISFAVGSQDGTPKGLFFKSDGTKMYIIGRSTSTVYQYSLSTAYDLSTASYDTVSFAVNAESSSPFDISFKSDGTKFYVIDNSSSKIFQYSLATAWDISTASYDNIEFSVDSQEGNPLAFTFNADGTNFYVVGNANKTIFQYSLATAWDISTASYDNISFNIGLQDDGPRGLVFSENGTKFYLAGTSTNTIYEYNTGASVVTYPSSVQNPPTQSYVIGDIITDTLYTLDGGTTVYVEDRHLDIPEAGLINGFGSGSLKNSDSLVSSPAVADGAFSIALGNAACVAAGSNASGVSIGCGSTSFKNGVSLGKETTANDSSVAIGNEARVTGTAAISIQGSGTGGVATTQSVAIGNAANATSDRSIAIGRLSCGAGEFGIAIGVETTATTPRATALGYDVTASKADTVTVKELETCVAGGGLIMTTPDGTAQYKLTIDNSGNLVTTVI